ncbi:MAG: hypothetical protein KAS98_00625 [Deltaproteobacteria bacterium]|nr:hypothetical protein [Deltaproteobacteria bacterium]
MVTKSVKAFAPANISCIFRLYEDKNPMKKGSLGVGFTLDLGATVRVSKNNKTIVKVNGKKENFKTVLSVINNLTEENVLIEIKTGVPFGSGFGMSGASALGTAYALNKLLKLKKTKKELAMVAHVAEVANSTGRGDVGGQFNGGIMAKFEKEPLKVEKLPIRQDYAYYQVFGELDTKKVINSKAKVALINKAGSAALRKVRKVKSFSELVSISKDFSIKSRLLKNRQVINKIKEIEKKGGKASMIMLGDAVFSDVYFKGCKKAKIIKKGARLL